jgi:hypothetical protein
MYNFSICRTCCSQWTWIKHQTSGYISGGLIFSHQVRHTDYWLVTYQYIRSTSGYGNLHVKTKRKFFFWLLLKDRLSTREFLKWKKYVFTELQLCALPWSRRVIASSFLQLSFCNSVLEHTSSANSIRAVLSTPVWSFQSPAPSPLLHGNCDYNVLGYLDLS